MPERLLSQSFAWLAQCAQHGKVVSLAQYQAAQEQGCQALMRRNAAAALHAGSVLQCVSQCMHHLQAGFHLQRLCSLWSLWDKPLHSGRPLLCGGDPADCCIGQPHRWGPCGEGLCPRHRLQLEDRPRVLPHQVCAWRYGMCQQGCREPPDSTACGAAFKVVKRDHLILVPSGPGGVSYASSDAQSHSPGSTICSCLWGAASWEGTSQHWLH